MCAYQENDYKPLYKSMKRKLKILIYENECFQEELRKAQRSLLKVQKDKSFLLDRILQYQQGPESSSDSEQTDDSDNDNYGKDNKRRKVNTDQSNSFSLNVQNNSKSSNLKKKKGNLNVLGSGVVVTKNATLCRQGSKQNSSSGASLSTLPTPTSVTPTTSCTTSAGGGANDGQMTREEIERQLAARQPISDFSTTVSLTLPNQLFSDNLNEGDLLDNEMETSPSNIGEDIPFENFD